MCVPRPEGNAVPKELIRLETSFAGYRAEVTAACHQTERCSTDQRGRGWQMRGEYSDDQDHLNLRGQAEWAEHVWGLLQQAQLVPSS